jgi:hypothetical protein
LPLPWYCSPDPPGDVSAMALVGSPVHVLHTV